MDPFAFYGLSRRFFLDEKELRRRFLEKSRLFHPDHMAGALSASQDKALELSGLNNSAYETLKDFHLRLRSILALEGVLAEDEQGALPQDFLMEMMELNEGLMDLQAEPDPERTQALEHALTEMEEGIIEFARPVMEAYDRGESVELKAVRDYHLKHRYLDRFRENLEKARA